MKSHLRMLQNRFRQILPLEEPRELGMQNDQLDNIWWELGQNF
jgi:hypothetical protein